MREMRRAPCSSPPVEGRVSTAHSDIAHGMTQRDNGAACTCSSLDNRWIIGHVSAAISATGTGSMLCHIRDHAGSHTLSSPAPLPPPVTITRVLDGQTTKSRTASAAAGAAVPAAAARFARSAAAPAAAASTSAPLDSGLPRQAAASAAGWIETTMYAATFEGMSRRGAE